MLNITNMSISFIRKLITAITFVIIFLDASQVSAQPSLPDVADGKIQRIEQFQSKYVTARNIDIWLPNGYAASKKYAVLYMHDGQMLFDSTQTWNKQAWNVDDVAAHLISTGKIKDLIIVGIWNGGQTRHQDYFPQKPFEQMSNVDQDTVVAQLQRAGRSKERFHPQSDKYLRLMVEELKPYIDKHYSVKTDKENTFIAGSSMGGLISLYALCEYPEIFGGAACLSTHWVGTFTMQNNPIPHAFINYLKQKLPRPNQHKIYFDCGDRTLDALYPPIQQQVDSLMAIKGFNDTHWITKYFPGDDHSEPSWQRRLHIPLTFLFSK
jgi:enterochelin esterase-like enzyme